MRDANDQRQVNYSMSTAPDVKFHDPGIEQEFITALVTNSDLVEVVFPDVAVEDLFNPVARHVYAEIRRLYESNEAINLVILHSRLTVEGALPYLLHQPQFWTRTTIKTLVKELKKWSFTRSLYQALEANLLRLRTGDASTVAEETLAALRSIAVGARGRRDPAEAYLTHSALMDLRYAGKFQGIPTGIADLDLMLGSGLQRQDLIVVGARPSVGKTSFALTVAYNSALKGFKSMFISCEMDANEIIDRLLAFHTGFPVSAIQRGKVKKEAVDKAYEQLKSLPFIISHVPKATSTEVHSIAQREKESNGLDLVVVDYLGFLSDEGENETLRLGRISRSLKTTANLLDVAVLAPHQLSRDIEKRAADKKTPLLSDLRDSGHIEQDSDVILFLNRDLIGTTPGKASLRIGKHRTGPTGIINLTFDENTTKFR